MKDNYYGNEYYDGDNLIDIWYQSEFPDDELGYMLNHIIFEDLYNAILSGDNVYDVIGVHDSIVRERLFAALNDIYGIDAYRIWLDNGQPDEYWDDTTNEVKDESGRQESPLVSATDVRTSKEENMLQRIEKFADNFEELLNDLYDLPHIYDVISDDEFAELGRAHDLLRDIVEYY